MNNFPNNLPCIDCITLGICKGIYQNYMIRNCHLRLWYKQCILCSILTERCSLLKKYLLPINKYGHSQRINRFHVYMMPQEKIDE